MAAKRGTPSNTKKAAQRNAIAHRQRQAAALALAYVPQTQIAERLGVSVGTISSDLKVVRGEWRKEARTDIQDAAIRELQSLDRLEAQLWSQFVDTTTRRVKVTKANGDEYEYDERIVSVGEKTRTAGAIMKAKERRAKMLGFDQPDLLEVRLTSGQVQAEIKRLTDKQALDGPHVLPG